MNEEEELEIYNPATSDQHKLKTLSFKKELKILALVNLFFIIFTTIFYSQYVKKYAGCPTEPPCWDFVSILVLMEPGLIFMAIMGTLASLIVLLFPLFRHSSMKEYPLPV